MKGASGAYFRCFRACFVVFSGVLGGLGLGAAGAWHIDGSPGPRRLATGVV